MQELRIGLTWLSIFLGIQLLVQSASAQQRPSVLVLPWYSEDQDPLGPERLRATADAVSTIVERSGYAILDPSVLRMRLLTYGHFPARITDEGRNELKRLAREALIAVGRMGRRSEGNLDEQLAVAARQSITKVMTFARDHIEALNRDDQLAEQVINACLLTPRLMVAEGTPEQLVVLEALECRKLVPNVKPLTMAHPPEVMAAVDKATKLATAMPRATLRVRTTDGCKGCIVLVNGRRLGVTPYEAVMVSGTYRVEVEPTDAPPGSALVHEVTLTAPHDAAVEVETFESYLRDAPTGVYIGDRDGRLPTSAMDALARRLDLDILFLLRAQTPALFDFRLFSGRRPDLNCLGSSSTEDFETSVPGLMRCPEATQAKLDVPVAPAERPNDAREPAEHSRPKRVRNTGIALASVGGALLAAAWVTQQTTEADKSASLVAGTYAMSTGAAALLTLSEPLWMPIGRRHAPWWAWTGMALGLVPVAAGVWQWSTDGQEVPVSSGVTRESGVSGQRYKTKMLGAVNFFSGVPLLALPASHYIARRLWRKSQVASVSATAWLEPGAMRLSVQGAF